MEVNKLTKLFKDKTMEFFSEVEFSVHTEKPSDEAGWKECDFKLGSTREQMCDFGEEYTIKSLAKSVIQCVYRLHGYPVPKIPGGITHPIYDIYIEEEPKIEHDFITDNYKATCKFKSRLVALHNTQDMVTMVKAC